jgi:hypothetical protein
MTKGHTNEADDGQLYSTSPNGLDNKSFACAPLEKNSIINRSTLLVSCTISSVPALHMCIKDEAVKIFTCRTRDIDFARESMYEGMCYGEQRLFALCLSSSWTWLGINSCSEDAKGEDSHWYRKMTNIMIPFSGEPGQIFSNHTRE